MLIIKQLDKQHYVDIWQQMQVFTIQRSANTMDEIWLLEHWPIYTQGQAGKIEHVLAPNLNIVHSDRGGQITYHATGQLIIYILINLQRHNLGIKTLVCDLEQLIIALLATYNITAQTCCGAPGVYVEQKKIASLGLRVKKGCTYHGIALNVNMDLMPFKKINPCGFKNLEMVNMCDYDKNITMASVIESIIPMLTKKFQINN